MSEAPAALSILTVNFRGAEALAAAQRGLAESPPAADFEWIVVNHSPEQRIEPHPALASRLRVIEEANLGFARGVNTAARAASAPILFLANPDLGFGGTLLDGGLGRLAADSKIGALGPRLRSPDGEIQRTARRFYDWPSALYARVPGRDRLRAPGFWRRHLMMDEALEHAAEVDWILGAALFIRRAALADPKGGVFDPRYFLYFEDVDLCMDLWRRGWRVRFDPSLEATHVHVRSSRHLWSPAARHHGASFLRFVGKWGGLPPRPHPRHPGG